APRTLATRADTRHGRHAAAPGGGGRAFLSARRPPARPTLFPYTTLFRSSGAGVVVPALPGVAEPADSFAQAHGQLGDGLQPLERDRKSTRLNSSHLVISYAVFCLKKKKRPLYTLPAETGVTRTLGAPSNV